MTSPEHDPAPSRPPGATAVSRRRPGPGGWHRRRLRRAGATAAGATAIAVVATTCLMLGVGRPQPPEVPADGARHSRYGEAPQPSPAQAAPQAVVPAAEAAVDGLPGVGRALGSRIPAESRQLVLVTGHGRDSSDSTLTVWNCNAAGHWEAVATWPAHNGFHGWTYQHTLDDLRSPIGLYTLGDAGGRRPDPGGRLPYHQDDRFEADGTGFADERLEGSFDYVIAIDYNRITGTSPLDTRRPQGSFRGGGIWLHVDHGGPTHGCVTVSEQHMVDLLRLLDPAAHPVIVMADAAALAA
ncbi:hypothetical protein GCM10009760_64460 [Kitasatospora kazusensis]|uniref:L,D-TPase catalytic domain-containing protein n=1 Tax=Kitasatospora kazusensis TaxID=407974 RepID=A0ABN1ZNR5_9ACTN